MPGTGRARPGVPGSGPCLSICTRVSWRNKDIAGTLSAVICSTHICRSLRPGCLPLRCPGFPSSRAVRPAGAEGSSWRGHFLDRLKLPNVASVGGSWLAISARARRAGGGDGEAGARQGLKSREAHRSAISLSSLEDDPFRQVLPAKPYARQPNRER